MAERDPAFLYYDADVALDVQHMNRQERGCYFDLVQMYRRYRGYTMEQLRKILGTDMESCWNALELVLVLDDVTGKYHIPWLRLALAKRAQSSEIQRERIQKYWDGVRKAEAEAIANGETSVKRRKRNGNTTDIPRNNIGNTTDIPLENENENKGIDEVIGGTGEKGEGREGVPGDDPATWQEGDWNNFNLEGSRLPSAMMEIFVTAFPEYPTQDFKDHPACWQLAYQIADLKGWKWQKVLNGGMNQLLEVWQEIVTWASADAWHKTKPITFWNNNFQGLIQAKNHGKLNAQPAAIGKSAGALELAGKLAKKLAARGSPDNPS